MFLDTFCVELFYKKKNMKKCLVVGYLGRGNTYLGEVQKIEKGMCYVKNEMGCMPVSILDNGVRASSAWVVHMVADVILLIRCHSLLLLPDWENSRTARILFKLATWLDKEIWCIED